MRIGTYAVAFAALLSGFSAAVAQDQLHPTKIFVCAPVQASQSRFYVRCPIGQDGTIISGQCHCPDKYVLLSNEVPGATPPVLVSQ